MKATLSGLPEKTFMKIIVDASSDKVVGIHMCGDETPEILQVRKIPRVFVSSIELWLHYNILIQLRFLCCTSAYCLSADEELLLVLLLIIKDVIFGSEHVCLRYLYVIFFHVRNVWFELVVGFRCCCKSGFDKENVRFNCGNSSYCSWRARHHENSHTENKEKVWANWGKCMHFCFLLVILTGIISWDLGSTLLCIVI